MTSRMPTGFFFVALATVTLNSVVPGVHVVGADAIGEVHERKLELYAVVLASRHDAAPQAQMPCAQR